MKDSNQPPIGQLTLVKPPRPVALPVDVSSIPDELKKYPNWTLWRYHWSRDKHKWVKPPFLPNGRMKRDGDSSLRFEEALRAFETGQFDGIGFALDNTPYTGVDLDDCINKPWALDIINALDSFSEVTPSGNGYHVLVRATLPPFTRNKNRNFHSAKVEIYDHARYFTVTGQVVPGFPSVIYERQNEIEKIFSPLIRNDETPPVEYSENKNVKTGNSTVCIDSNEIIKRGEKVFKNKFSELFFNGNSGGDHSADDLSLCNMLAFLTGRNPDLIDEVFRKSALMRPKWDERRGSTDYGQMTIHKALADCQRVYQENFSVEVSRADEKALPQEGDALSAMVERFAFIVEGERVADLHDRCPFYSMRSLRELKSEYRLKIDSPNHEKKVLISTAWLDSSERKTLRATTFRPDKKGQRVVSQGDNRFYNVYTQPEWPALDGVPTTFLDHVCYLLPDEREREYFLNWLAVLVQKPGARMPMVLMVTKCFGVGRGTLSDFISKLFGAMAGEVAFPEFCGVGSQGQYNEWAENKVFIAVGEAKDIGDGNRNSRYTAYEHIKTMVDTRPVLDFQFKRKYGRNGPGQLFANYLCMCNHYDALIIPENDRRVNVLSNPEQKNTSEYYGRIISVLREQPEKELARAWHWLMRRDISGFDHTYPLNTEGKERMTELSESEEDRLFKQITEDMLGDIAHIEQFKHFVHRANSHISYDDGAMRRLENRFREFPPVATGDRRWKIRVAGKQVRPLIVRNIQKWQNEHKTGNSNAIKRECLKNTL